MSRRRTALLVLTFAWGSTSPEPALAGEVLFRGRFEDQTTISLTTDRFTVENQSDCGLRIEELVIDLAGADGVVFDPNAPGRFAGDSLGSAYGDAGFDGNFDYSDPVMVGEPEPREAYLKLTLRFASFEAWQELRIRVDTSSASGADPIVSGAQIDGATITATLGNGETSHVASGPVIDSYEILFYVAEAVPGFEPVEPPPPAGSPLRIEPPGPVTEAIHPFGEDRSVIYQQVYAASLFPGPVRITELRFFRDIPQTRTSSGNLEVYLSTTDRAVNDLARNIHENRGPDEKLFFQDYACNPVWPDVRIPGDAFDYDPAAGNLLVHMVKSHGRNAFGGWQAGYGTFGDLSSRMYNVNGGPPESDFESHGMVTEFWLAPPVPVPATGPFGSLALGAALALSGLAMAKHRGGHWRIGVEAQALALREEDLGT